MLSNSPRTCFAASGSCAYTLASAGLSRKRKSMTSAAVSAGKAIKANAPSSENRRLVSWGIGCNQPLVECVERIGNDRIKSFGWAEQAEVASLLVLEQPYPDKGIEPIAAKCNIHVE